nr:hypothetical protein [Aulosira sp. ZfuVER01]
MTYLKQHSFRDQQVYSANKIFLVTVSCLSLIVSGCSQKASVNVAGNSDSASKIVSSNQTTETFVNLLI